MTDLDVATLVLRAALGVTMAAHGYNHVLGPGGLAGTARWFASIGLRPAKVHAALSGFGELACGIGLIAGLLTPLCAAFVVGTMTVAGVTVHRRNGFFIFKEGFEYVLILAVLSLVLGLLGPGTYSVDSALGLNSLAGAPGVLIAAGGVLGAALLLAVSWRPALVEANHDH